MNLRTLTLSVAVLAAACLAIWFLQRPSAPLVNDTRVGQSVLAADLATRAAQIRITDSDKNVTLARQSTGTWRVTTYHDLPADFTKLSQLISDLSDAKIQRFVTARPERLARLEFKDTTITLLDADAKEIWTATLGKSADGGGRFLRYGKEEKGYQFAPNFSLESESKNWVDTALLNLKQDDIAAVEIGFTDGTTVAAKRAKKEDPWTSANAPAGNRLKPDRIASVLGNLVSLRFSDTSATDDPAVAIARAHSRTLKLTTFAGDTYTVTLGRKPEEKKPKQAVADTKPHDNSAPASPEAKPQDESRRSPEGEGGPKPEFETIPAGPVYAFIKSSNEKTSINDVMKRRAFQIGEWTFNALPAQAPDLWEDLPPLPAPEPKKYDGKAQADSPAEK